MTFHCPGQLVGYPIIDLKRHKQDLHWYLRQLEQAIIQTLERFGVFAERSTGYTGVWTKGKKIASIGVHARDWVTWHGIALNVNTDLSFFDLIVPCGIQGVVMTSLEKESGAHVTVNDVAPVFARELAALFDLSPVETPLEQLMSGAA